MADRSTREPGARRGAAKPAGTATPSTRPTPAKRASAALAPESASVEDFLAAVPDPTRRADSAVLLRMMQDATGCAPVLWGGGIVGFDQYHYRYDSGREGDAPILGFSPRASALTVYLMPGLAGFAPLLARLGRHTTGSACLYIKRLVDVDLEVLGALLCDAVAGMRQRYPR